MEVVVAATSNCGFGSGPGRPSSRARMAHLLAALNPSAPVPLLPFLLLSPSHLPTMFSALRPIARSAVPALRRTYAEAAPSVSDKLKLSLVLPHQVSSTLIRSAQPWILGGSGALSSISNIANCIFYAVPSDPVRLVGGDAGQHPRRLWYDGHPRRPRAHHRGPQARSR